MPGVEPELATPHEGPEPLGGLLDALDRENAELRERLVALGAAAARSRAELKLARAALEAARADLEEGRARIGGLTEERDRERASAMAAAGAREALEAALDERAGTLAELDVRIRELEEDLQASRREQAASAARHEGMQQELDLAADRLAQSEQRARTVEERLQASQAEAGRLGRSVDDQARGRERAESAHRQALAVAEEHRRTAARQRARADKFDAQLKELRSSTSYKLMKVLWRIKSTLLLRGFRAARAERRARAAKPTD